MVTIFLKIFSIAISEGKEQLPFHCSSLKV